MANVPQEYTATVVYEPGSDRISYHTIRFTTELPKIAMHQCMIDCPIPFHLSSRYTFGVVSPPNVLTNAGGDPAIISIDGSGSLFTLASFYATPVYVPMLTLTLDGTRSDGSLLTTSIHILSPDRTHVSFRMHNIELYKNLLLHT